MYRATYGWLAYYRNDLTEAESQFRRAEDDLFYEDYAFYSIEKGLNRDGSCHLCYAGLAYIAEFQDKLDDAINYAASGLAVTRYDPELVTQLNKLLIKKNSLSTSRVIYEKLNNISPEAPVYQVNFGYVYLHLNLLELAEKQFLAALAVEPRLTMAQNGLLLVTANKKNSG